MKKPLLCVLVLLFFSCLIVAIGGSNSPFIASFPSEVERSWKIRTIVERSDGGLLFCGDTHKDLKYFGFIMETSMYGVVKKMIYVKGYGYYGRFDAGCVLDENDDIYGAGGFSAGQPVSDNFDPWIVKISGETGDVLWEKTIPNLSRKKTGLFGTGLALYGEYVYFSFNKISEDEKVLPCFSKFTKRDGDLLLNKVMVGSGDEYSQDLAISGEEGKEGLIYIGEAEATEKDELYSMFISKIGEKGETEWTWITTNPRVMGTIDNVRRRIINLKDGYLITGSSSGPEHNNLFFLKIDFTGKEMWSKELSIKEHVVTFSGSGCILLSDDKTLQCLFSVNKKGLEDEKEVSILTLGQDDGGMIEFLTLPNSAHDSEGAEMYTSSISSAGRSVMGGYKRNVNSDDTELLILRTTDKGGICGMYVNKVLEWTYEDISMGLKPREKPTLSDEGLFVDLCKCPDDAEGLQVGIDEIMSGIKTPVYHCWDCEMKEEGYTSDMCEGIKLPQGVEDFKEFVPYGIGMESDVDWRVEGVINIDMEGKTADYVVGFGKFGEDLLRSKMFVAKVDDRRGGVIWMKYFAERDGCSFEYDGRGNAIVQGEKQIYVTCICRSLTSPEKYPLVIKMNPEKGDIIWQKEIGIDYHNFPLASETSIIRTSIGFSNLHRRVYVLTETPDHEYGKGILLTAFSSGEGKEEVNRVIYGRNTLDRYPDTANEEAKGILLHSEEKSIFLFGDTKNYGASPMTVWWADVSFLGDKINKQVVLGFEDKNEVASMSHALELFCSEEFRGKILLQGDYNDDSAFLIITSSSDSMIVAKVISIEGERLRMGQCEEFCDKEIGKIVCFFTTENHQKSYVIHFTNQKGVGLELSKAYVLNHTLMFDAEQRRTSQFFVNSIKKNRVFENVYSIGGSFKLLEEDQDDQKATHNLFLGKMKVDEVLPYSFELQKDMRRMRGLNDVHVKDWETGFKAEADRKEKVDSPVKASLWNISIAESKYDSKHYGWIGMYEPETKIIDPRYYTYWSCEGKTMDLKSSGCNHGNGTCKSPHFSCECGIGYDGLFCTQEIELPICNGLPSNETAVCGGHGTCNKDGTCTCNNPAKYAGLDCEYPICYGKVSKSVCYGHGVCTKPNQCECDETNHFFGMQCAEEILIDEVGSSRKCLFVIRIGYVVPYEILEQFNLTETFDCCDSVVDCSISELSSEDTTCHFELKYNYSEPADRRRNAQESSGVSIESTYLVITSEGGLFSVSPENIHLIPITDQGKTIRVVVIEKEGKETVVEGTAAWVTPTLSSLGILLLLLLAFCFCCTLSLYCFSFLICCCCCMVLCPSVSGMGSIAIKQKKELDKFEQLEDFDILLSEQKAERHRGENDGGASLSINSSLFEIKFDEIKLLKILGSGGSGAVVYLSLWAGKKVAFKVFKTRDMSNSENFSEFEKEARIGIVMEYCENGDIKGFIGMKCAMNDTIDTPMKIRLLEEIGAGMSFLHSRKIVHRDLKCENVLLDKSFVCKVMDFGLSRILDGSSDSIRMTKHVGTSYYMAPEVCLGSSYDEKCDVFSFAIMMYEIWGVTISPYGENALPGIEMKVALNEEFRPDITLLGETCPDWYSDLMARCWSNKKRERPSFREIIECLEENGGDLESSSKDESEKKKGEEEDVRDSSDGGSSDEEEEDDEKKVQKGEKEETVSLFDHKMTVINLNRIIEGLKKRVMELEEEGEWTSSSSSYSEESTEIEEESSFESYTDEESTTEGERGDSNDSSSSSTLSISEEEEDNSSVSDDNKEEEPKMIVLFQKEVVSSSDELDFSNNSSEDNNDEI